MTGRVGTLLARLGLNRAEKAARKRDLDAAQRLFLHCAQGALSEAVSGREDGPRDPRVALYEQIEARLADAGVSAVAELPQAVVAELALHERAVLSGEQAFADFLESLASEDREYALHLRETWEADGARFEAARRPPP